MASSPRRTQTPRNKYGVASGSGDSISVSGTKRAGGGDDGDSGRVKLELCRGREEGLGMVLVLEEDHDSPSGRKVLVKSITPGGAAQLARRLSRGDDVTTGGRAAGFRINDVVLEIDGHVLDEMGEEDCLDVLHDIPDRSVFLVQRGESAAAKTSRLSSSPSPTTTTLGTASPPHSPSSALGKNDSEQHTTTSSPPLSTVTDSSRNAPSKFLQAATRLAADSSEERGHPSAGAGQTAPSFVGGEGSGRRAASSSDRSEAAPRPAAARKVRRQKSTAAHLAERGLPGFLVRRVTVCRAEGQGLGLSIVPSCGATKFYYQVKRLLPGGVCAGTPGLHEGDRLLECNGHSLQGLTQARCLHILKDAGPRVTLTLLHEQDDARGARDGEVKVKATPTTTTTTTSPRRPRLEAKAGQRSGIVGEAKRGVPGVETHGKRPAVQDQTDTGADKSGESSVNGSSPLSSPLKTSPRSDPHTRNSEPRTVSDRSKNGTVSDDNASSSASSRQKRTPPRASRARGMSNPFLDPDPPQAEGGGQAGEDGVEQRRLSALNPNNPFYSDVVFGGSGAGSQPSGVPSSNPFYADVVLGGDEEGVCVPPPLGSFSGVEHVVGEGGGEEGVVVMEEDVLLELGGGEGGEEERPPTTFTGMTGAVDLLGGLSGESDDVVGGSGGGGIPPPAEFSDLGGLPVLQPQTVHSPAATSDDLVNLGEFATSATSHVSPAGEEASEGGGKTQSGSSSSGFDFLLDAGESRQTGPSLLMDITEEEQESSSSSSYIHAPSPAPVLPPSPPDAALSPQVPSVGVEQEERMKVMNVQTADFTNSSGDVQGNNDTLHHKQPTLRSFVPPNAFLPTSVGITRTLLTTTGGAKEEEEEEEIKPMTVHRDHQGNKLAAPSPSPSPRQGLTRPRTLDEAAKRDLQAAMTRMTSTPRRAPPPVTRKDRPRDEEDGSARVLEEEIVPVKLTRREADTARDVLATWGTSQDKTPTASSTLTSTFSKTSGFQKAVGVVLDVQAGRKDLPNDSVFLTTMGVTRHRTSGQQGEEEEITPMALHKDHLGNKHYVPSSLQSRETKPPAPRQLDSVAKQDIAAVLSAMPARAKGQGQGKPARDTDPEHVIEEEVKATVLTKDQSRLAVEAVTRWLSADHKAAEQPQSKASAFQRLVTSAVQSAAQADEDSADEATSEKEGTGKKEPVEEIVTPVSTTVSSSASPPTTTTTPEKPTAPAKETPEEKPSPPPPANAKPAPPPVMPKPTLAERRTLFEDADHHHDTKQQHPTTTTTAAAKPAGFEPHLAGQKDARPVPTQRTLRGPGKIGSLSQTSSLSAPRPLSKIGGGLSITTRTGTPSLVAPKAGPYSSSSSFSSGRYGKTRSEDQPFLVEVLKGILGLGLKVKVTEQGHVEVTEVQRNSAVAKNGNVRVGDYLLSVNGTELAGLSESRVQQVLRLLPRVLVKLVVSARPTLPPDTQEADSAEVTGAGDSSSPRSAGSFSQYGVRLSPQPFSPSTDGQPPSLSPHPTPPPHTAPAHSGEPLTVDVEEDDDDDEMSMRKLSKALSPRSTQVYTPDTPTPPKPTPRQRVLPTSLSTTPKGSPRAEEPPAEVTPRKPERPLTVSELVAAASRRPSGRDDDLPQPPPPPVSPPPEVTEKDEGKFQESSSKHPASDLDPVLKVSRTASGHGGDLEDVPVFAAAAKNLGPVPSPRVTSTSSSGDLQDSMDTALTSRGHAEDVAVKKPEERSAAVQEVVQAQSSHVSHAAPSPPVAAKSAKVPPPVAPKPKRTSSVNSDKSYSSGHSDDAPKDLPSPTLVSSKLKDFADPGPPASEDPAQSRKFVSSAARMFERKATEVKPVSPLTRPTKSSRPVSSVVSSFNRAQDSEPSGKSEVVMRRVSVGVGGGGGVTEGEGGKRLNSALLPPGERRRSTPVQFSGTPSSSSSLQLTKPSSLSHLRHPHQQTPARGGPAPWQDGEDRDKASPRLPSSLRPRQGPSSLRSVIASREQREDRGGTDKDAADTSDVTYRSQPSSAREVTSRKHASWSPQSGDTHTPRMIFTSSSLHHSPRYGSSSTSSTTTEHPEHLESTMKKFDDLLSDKHTFDSDEELPKVSNSVSLDLLRNRSVGKVAATMKSSERSTQDPASASERKEDGGVGGEKKSPGEESLEKPDAVTEKASVPSQKAEDGPSLTPAAETARERLAPVEEDSTAVTAGAAESSPADKADKAEEEEKVEKTDAQLQQLGPEGKSETKAEESEKPGRHTQTLVDQVKTETEIKANDESSEQPQHEPPPEPQRKPRKPRLVEEEAADAYPEEDTAGPPSPRVPGHRVCPAEGEKAAPVTEDDYPPEDSAVPVDLAHEVVFRHQASTIVHTVISNAIKDVASRPRQEKVQEVEEEDDGAPPPLPSEEPPPLPGAPPPPLILRSAVQPVMAAEDLVGMLPSQSGASATSSPRSLPDTGSPQVTPRRQPRHSDVVESEDVEVEIQETVSADTAARDLALPLGQNLLEPEPRTEGADDKEEAVRDSDVLISFHSPTQTLPPAGDVADKAQEEHPPVSDTLSQDSGVQDEDMSEDGLRFSHDESPTSQGDSSSLFDTAVTPEELPASLLKETEEVGVGMSHVPASKSSPLPSPRSKAPPPISPRSLSPSSRPAPTQTAPAEVEAQNSADRHRHSAQGSACVQKPAEHVQSRNALKAAESSNADTPSNSVSVKKGGVNSVNTTVNKQQTPDVPRLPLTDPPPQPPSPSQPSPQSPEDNDEDDDPDSHSATVKSRRKWYILDQSGSLFLHGEKDSEVRVGRGVLRQVSSLSPGDLRAMVAEANGDLDGAGLLVDGVEVRVVSARGLTGRTLSLEVAQRPDYLVQVTRVHSKESPVQEGDLLMFVDGRTLKNRRPAQVQSQLESTGPKGVLLTARGVRLPSSLARLQEDRSSESDSNSESPRSVSTPTSSTPAVLVRPGVYDVIMVKGATGVGFCLEGGKASPKGDLPILIKRIFRGGPAEKCGHLKVGDEILAVNGVDFTTMRHYEAWNHLKFLDDGEVQLRIQRQET
ncbi:uncharacterized protein LOC143297395 [Babylonia areolata]|uniref:uncharacterized protein LOC143297395 n=1 Tax=Babylonia areolata TaxID=304850 RepID=UPI003FD6AA40